MSEETKIELNEQQHKEMLLFTEGTLQDIRERKSIQLRILIGAISLLGALSALASRIKPLTCPWKFILVLSALFIGIFGTYFFHKQQKSIIEFRGRLKKLYNNHFSLKLKPIIGKDKSYDDPKAFRPFGDEVPIWIFLLWSAVSIICIWIIVTT